MGWGMFSHKAWATTDFKKYVFYPVASPRLLHFHHWQNISVEIYRRHCWDCCLDRKNKLPSDCVEDCQADGPGEKDITLCACWYGYLMGALVQHCESWCLNVDFATLRRTAVYYCCSHPLDHFIWHIICEENNLAILRHLHNNYRQM